MNIFICYTNIDTFVVRINRMGDSMVTITMVDLVIESIHNVVNIELY